MTVCDRSGASGRKHNKPWRDTTHDQGLQQRGKETMETIADDSDPVQDKPEKRCMLPSGYAEELRVIVATLQARHPMLADVLGRANAVLVNGNLYPSPDGTEAYVRSMEDGEHLYHTNGQCTCPAATHHPEDVCKHRYGLRLHQLVMKALEKQGPVQTEAPAQQSEDHPDVIKIPSQFLQRIHGKLFVRYVGLLAMAHEQGLVKLEATFVSVTATLAIAESTATFADGRIFADAADATPENVHFEMKPHFPRLALTRAKARCLRDALNLSMCSVEEMD
jgi:hypothetical protein